MPQSRQDVTRILVLDPGETTGWATCEYYNDHLEVIETGEIVFCVSRNTARIAENIKEFCVQTKALEPVPDVIVVEDIVSHGQLNADKIIQTRAMERALTSILSFAVLDMVEPPELFKHNPELKNRAELWGLDNDLPSSPHEADAVRHARVWAELR